MTTGKLYHSGKKRKGYAEKETIRKQELFKIKSRFAKIIIMGLVEETSQIEILKEFKINAKYDRKRQKI